MVVEVGVEAEGSEWSVVMRKRAHKVVAHSVSGMGSWGNSRRILFINNAFLFIIIAWGKRGNMRGFYSSLVHGGN